MPHFYFVFSMLVLISYTITLKKLSPKFRFVFKMVNSTNFIILAAICFLYNRDIDSVFFLVIMASLLFGFIGDFFLGLRNFYSEHKNLYFKIGLLSFLSGHLIYLCHFAGSIAHVWYYCIIGILATLSVFFLIYKKLQVSFGKHRFLVWAYMVIIISTLLSAAFYLSLSRTIFSIIFFIGFLFFLISDVLLSFIYFTNLKTRTHSTFRLLNALSYFTGQLLIAWSLLFL